MREIPGIQIFCDVIILGGLELYDDDRGHATLRMLCSYFAGNDLNVEHKELCTTHSHGR